MGTRVKICVYDRRTCYIQPLGPKVSIRGRVKNTLFAVLERAMELCFLSCCVPQVVCGGLEFGFRTFRYV